MDKLKYEKLMEANSRAEAEIIESFLESQGIDVELIEESVSHTSYAISIVRVDVFVPAEKMTEAREIVNSPNEFPAVTDDEPSNSE